MALKQEDIQLINEIVKGAIENELAEFIGIDKYSFQKHIKIFNEIGRAHV